ncbi:MAG: peptidoglycan-binding protein [Pseudomonadota bacterium]
MGKVTGALLVVAGVGAAGYAAPGLLGSPGSASNGFGLWGGPPTQTTDRTLRAQRASDTRGDVRPAGRPMRDARILPQTVAQPRGPQPSIAARARTTQPTPETIAPARRPQTTARLIERPQPVTIPTVDEPQLTQLPTIAPRTINTRAPIVRAPPRAIAATRQRREEAQRLAATRVAARVELVKTLQRELRRVGCFNGKVDGIWGSQSRRAMTEFTATQRAQVPVYRADRFLLALVQDHNGLACRDETTIAATPRALPAPIVVPPRSLQARRPKVDDIAALIARRVAPVSEGAAAQPGSDIVARPRLVRGPRPAVGPSLLAERRRRIAAAKRATAAARKRARRLAKIGPPPFALGANRRRRARPAPRARYRPRYRRRGRWHRRIFQGPNLNGS